MRPTHLNGKDDTLALPSAHLDQLINVVNVNFGGALRNTVMIRKISDMNGG